MWPRSWTPHVIALGCAGAALGCSFLYSADNISGASSSSSSSSSSGSDSGGCGFLLCDGFEGDLSAWSTQDTTNGGAVALDTARAYRGKSGLHAHMIATPDGNPVNARLVRNQTWPAHMFVRVFVYLKAPWTATSGIVVLNGTDPAQGVAFYVSQSDGPHPATSTFGAGLDAEHHSSVTAALDTWVCFEVESDAVNGQLHVSMDGQRIPELDQSAPFPAMGRVSVGLSASNDAASDAWLDEVAVDDKPIGCER